MADVPATFGLEKLLQFREWNLNGPKFGQEIRQTLVEFANQRYRERFLVMAGEISVVTGGTIRLAPDDTSWHPVLKHRENESRMASLRVIITPHNGGEQFAP